MQKNIFLLSVWLIMQAAVQAQIIAGNAFIKGNYAEVGVSGLGGFEGASTGGGVPGGFHPRTLGGGIFGMVANPQMNGWSAPNFDGEFIGETYYENGWGFDFYPAGGGSPLSIRNDLYGINDVAGAVSNYQSMPGYVSVDFTGNYVSTGFDLSFLINYRINTNDLFFTTTVSVTNNHTDTIPAFYFHRTCNADNNAPLTLVTATTNTIESQATGTSITARVSSTQSTPWLSYIGLVGYDPAFRAGISPIFSATATAVWSATGGVLGTTGATTTADQPISLAFRKLNFLPGETTTFTYYTVFSPDVVPNIEASIYGEYEGAGHVVHDSLADQVYACGAVDISLEGFYRDNHNWTWTPNTYLSTDTGVAVTSTPLDTVVYTITGTGLDTVVYTITMIPAVPPAVVVTDPGPQCGTYDLGTLVYSDTTALPATVSYFTDDYPQHGYDLSAQYTSSVITVYDSVYLLMTDTLTGCYDVEPVNIFWEDVLYDFTYTTTSCTTATAVASVSNFSVGGYSILWSTGATTATVTGLPVGLVAVSVTSASGCVSTDTAMIVENTFTMALSQTPEGCGNANGTAAVAWLSDSTDTYVYAWSSGQTVPAIDNLVSGSYLVTVTNQDGCVSTDSIFVGTIATTFSLTVADFDATCMTCPDGSIYTFLSGSPLLPVTYVWSNGGTTANLFGVVPGTYTVVATDAAGCTWSDTVIIGSPDGVNEIAFDVPLRVYPNPAGNVVNFVCNDIMDEATLHSVDGRLVKTLVINNTVGQMSLEGLNKGLYILKIKSGNLLRKTRLVKQ